MSELTFEMIKIKDVNLILAEGQDKATLKIAAVSQKSIVFETASGDFITFPRPENVEASSFIDKVYEVTKSTDGNSIILVEQPSFKKASKTATKKASKTATAANQTPNFNEKFSGMSRYKD